MVPSALLIYAQSEEEDELDEADSAASLSAIICCSVTRMATMIASYLG